MVSPTSPSPSTSALMSSVSEPPGAKLPKLQTAVSVSITPWLVRTSSTWNPSTSGTSRTPMFVAASGPKFSSTICHVMVSPSKGVVSLTVFVMLRSAYRCCTKMKVESALFVESGSISVVSG